MNGFNGNYNIMVKQMIRMNHILDVMFQNLENNDILDVLLKETGYSEQYFCKVFKEYFGMPYHKFLNKLKFRFVAENILMGTGYKECWKKMGFLSASSFSTAFKKEFGVGVREYKKQFKVITPMDARKTLFEVPISITFLETEASKVYGYPIEVKKNYVPKLSDDAAFYLDKNLFELDKYNELEKTCFWWNDKSNNNEPYYLVCFDEKDYSKLSSIKNKLVSMEMPADSYAVFSFKRDKDDLKTMQMTRLLTKYALLEWPRLAYRITNRFAYTYEKHDAENVYVYVPLISQHTVREEKHKSKDIDFWLDYINENITSELTIKKLANHFFYSEKNYKELFKMYYEIGPLEYILKRRLYLAAEEIANGSDSQLVAKKYRFDSEIDFLNSFVREFKVSPAEYRTVNVKSVRLSEYYNDYKESINVSIRTIDPIFFMYKDVLNPKEKRDKKNVPDVPERVCHWFLNDFKELEKTSFANSGNKIGFWIESPGETVDSYLYDYAVGPVCNERDMVNGMGNYMLSGGKYAVFTTNNKDDTLDMVEIYRMLTRCVFHSWVKENIYRYDGDRITFVQFYDNKLYFYVPLNH